MLKLTLTVSINAREFILLVRAIVLLVAVLLT